MRILYVVDKYRAASGGADRFAQGVVHALRGAGHAVRILVGGQRAHEQDEDGVTIVERPLPKSWIFRDSDLQMLRWNAAWVDTVAAEIEAFHPDRLLTQNVLAPSSIAAAKRAKIPSTLFFHGYRCLSPTFFYRQDALTAPFTDWKVAPWRSKLKWPIVETSLMLYDATYRYAEQVIANSLYTAKVVKRFFDRPAEVFYPILDLASAADTPFPAGEKIPPADGPILFIKPQKIKGVENVLQVARRMPTRRFCVVGTASWWTRWRLSRLPNVELRGWVEDLAALFQQASVLFAPSEIPEPFGRIFVEAGLQGLPSVASRAGGIPEAVGEGGILLDVAAGGAKNPTPETWVQALEEVITSPRRAEWSRAARVHAQRLVGESNPGRFLRLLRLSG